MQAALCIIIFLILQKKVVYLTPHKSKTSSKTLKVKKKKHFITRIWSFVVFSSGQRATFNTVFLFYSQCDYLVQKTYSSRKKDAEEVKEVSN